VGKIHAEVSCTVLGDISLSEFLSVPTNTMSQPPVGCPGWCIGHP
jgi:hypothetical protein